MITTTDYDNKNVFLKESELRYHYGTPVRCNHIVLVFVTAGVMEVELNYTVYNVKPRSLILVSPLDIITIKGTSEDYKDFKLVIPTTLIKASMFSSDINFYEKIKSEPITCLDDKEFEIVNNIFNTLLIIRDSFDYEHFEASLLNSAGILFQLYHQHLKKSGNSLRSVYESRKKTLFKKFVKELVASYNKSREVLYYANELGVSAGYLNEVCNEISNYSAKDIIDQAVSSRLKSELAYTDKSVQELADEYNFPSQSYFSRYYKRLTGLSPTEFRKKRQNGYKE